MLSFTGVAASSASRTTTGAMSTSCKVSSQNIHTRTHRNDHVDSEQGVFFVVQLHSTERSLKSRTATGSDGIAALSRTVPP